MYKKTAATKLRESLARIVRLFRHFFYTKYFGMVIHPTARIALSARLDKTNPKGIVIGEYSYITFGAAILTHDMCTQKRCQTKIGNNVFVGANSIIMPGVTVANNVIIGAGSIVTKDIPSNVIVAGNPAAVIRRDISNWYGKFGILDQTRRKS
jgi:acetyltransferase-like isoleucine patch superfamily enzyme